MVKQVCGKKIFKRSSIQILFREGFSYIEKNNCFSLDRGQDLNYHAETCLSDIL